MKKRTFTTMKKLREIHRLHFNLQFGAREIGRLVKLTHPTILEYIRRFRNTGLDKRNISQLSDEQVAVVFRQYSTRHNDPRFQPLVDSFPYFSQELKKKGVTLQILWEEYIEENSKGYRRTQFFEYYRAWRKDKDLSMHICHKVGDKYYTDFTGHKMTIQDFKSGKETEVELLVSMLPATQLLFAKALPSQKTPDFIKGNVDALEYFGGSPKACTPDCLKSGVTKADRYEPKINEEFEDFARHYGMVVVPARSRKPKDKALVEGAVKIVYQRVFAPLRHQVFYSIEELNKAIKEKIDMLNNRVMKLYQKSRRDMFVESEKEELNSLPTNRYHLRRIASNRTVQYNYHVYLPEDRHYYSVPTYYRKKKAKVDVYYTSNAVEIFHNNQRICTHRRDRKTGGYTTDKNHMPKNHRYIADWSPERFIFLASQKGPEVKIMVQSILKEKKFPEQAFKSCSGVIHLSKKFGDVRLAKACKRAISYGTYSYQTVKEILLKNLDKNDEEQLPLMLPVEHENVRGSDYYESVNTFTQ